jgi:hypothetical protein
MSKDKAGVAVADVPVEAFDHLASKLSEAMASVQARVRPLENPNPPLETWNIKPGVERPKLRRKTFFCGSEQNEYFLSDREIDLFNRVRPGRYHGRRWEVVGRGDDGSDAIEIRVPVASSDDKMALPPSLVYLLTEIVDEGEARAGA